MPLRDHFHAPWRERCHWEGLPSAWVNTMVRHLNTNRLPCVTVPSRKCIGVLRWKWT
jgi:hypothetical protein